MGGRIGSIASLLQHRVAQGECIDSLAFRHGLPADVLWALDENEALRRRRRHGNALEPGDVVCVPPPRPRHLTAATGTRVRCRRLGVPLWFEVVFEEDGRPRAGARVQVRVDEADPVADRTGNDGHLAVPIPPDASTIRVVFDPEGEAPEPFEFMLGALDPVDTPSGQRSRLANLGVEAPAAQHGGDAELASLLRAFQAREGLEVTGRADPGTLDRLASLHGS